MHFFAVKCYGLQDLDHDTTDEGESYQSKDSNWGLQLGCLDIPVMWRVGQTSQEFHRQAFHLSIDSLSCAD